MKGGKTRDIPLPAAAMRFLHAYVERGLTKEVDRISPEAPLFWSTWGRRAVGKTHAPMTGKNIWRLCKVYGRANSTMTIRSDLDAYTRIRILV